MLLFGKKKPAAAVVINTQTSPTVVIARQPTIPTPVTPVVIHQQPTPIPTAVVVARSHPSVTPVVSTVNMPTPIVVAPAVPKAVVVKRHHQGPGLHAPHVVLKKSHTGHGHPVSLSHTGHNAAFTPGYRHAVKSSSVHSRGVAVHHHAQPSTHQPHQPSHGVVVKRHRHI